MAVDTYVVGNDGNVTIGTETVIKIRSFAANLSRTKSDVTAFGDSGKRVRYGFLNVAGSLNGIMLVDATNTGVTTQASIFWAKTSTVSLTLSLYGTNTKIVSGVGMDSFAFNSDKSGDATVTANFETGDGTAVAVTWMQ